MDVTQLEADLNAVLKHRDDLAVWACTTYDLILRDNLILQVRQLDAQGKTLMAAIDKEYFPEEMI